MEELADVATAPRSKRDERKPWGFNSALLRVGKVTGWASSAGSSARLSGGLLIRATRARISPGVLDTLILARWTNRSKSPAFQAGRYGFESRPRHRCTPLPAARAGPPREVMHRGGLCGAPAPQPTWSVGPVLYTPTRCVRSPRGV